MVDFQSRLFPAISNGAAAVANTGRVARAAKLLGIPVLATEQNSKGLGATVEELAGLAQAVLEKSHFDATREPSWPSFLPAGRRDVVVTGSETHVCVLQTATGLLDRGCRVRVVSDAVGSRTQQNWQAGLRRAERHGAELVTAEMVMFEWLESCEHPQFRSVLALLK